MAHTKQSESIVIMSCQCLDSTKKEKKNHHKIRDRYYHSLLFGVNE